MTFAGPFLRRNFEPLVLSLQVLIDLAVVLFACWLGYTTREPFAVRPTALESYREIFLLTGAVSLVCFHAFRMYSPIKSLLNVEEFAAIAKSTPLALLGVAGLIVFLRSSGSPDPNQTGWVGALHKFIDVNPDPGSYSRVTVLLAFGYILILMTLNRFCAFKVIQMLHRRGIGNRNALIVGTGPTAKKLQKKFVLVPTLGLNLIGLVSNNEDEVGNLVERSRVLGTVGQLEDLVRRHKISEVFVAMPEIDEEPVMRIVEELERLGVVYRVVPRFYHFLSHKVRIESLDSIPLFSRPDRDLGVLTRASKRALDIGLALFVLAIAMPVFVISALLIKRESKGPVYFLQTRIGKDGKPFRMIKFRTMHEHLSYDAPAPKHHADPRVTNIGRLLRRYSLDELPQLLNVLRGEMSIVGPRPEMPFIVATYGPIERERLRAKPGLTGLWQISYARGEAIHENLDYDLYYIEHQSLMLDFVIMGLTGFAVFKGTGAY
ncbi:MAG TPA: sugar transferase [Planctomycetota bacterium]|nr:sugar transferase [Planctomycetota bacterium]